MRRIITDEQYDKLLESGNLMPYPGVMRSYSGFPMGNHDPEFKLEEPKKPLSAYQQKKHWKKIRKERRLQKKG